MVNYPENSASFSAPVKRLWEDMRKCALCPRRCSVNRLSGEMGYCRTAAKAMVSSFMPHFGEESVLVGSGGSGTIFFAGCNLSCVFCQNYDISQQRTGSEVSVDGLAEIMLSLEQKSCCNINFVSPTHVAASVAAAIELARKKGLTVPTVYNSGGYDSVDTLSKLDGLIYIYMPDMKYGEPVTAAELSDAPDYPEVCFRAVQEMHNQVGDLRCCDGVAVKGLLIRHLVLPNGVAASERIVDFLVREISRNTAINVMGQYRPCYEAAEYAFINRLPTRNEIEQVRSYARTKGLRLL